MANWSRPAIIEELLLYDVDSAGTTINESKIDLSGGFINFEYYESLFSPHITANLIYVDTGNSVEGSGDVQERIGEVFNSSTNFKGKRLDIRISHESSSTGLNLANYPLEVIGFNPMAGKDKIKSYLLFMASEYASKNENTEVNEKYSNSISDSVKKILTDKLTVPSDRITVDKTRNSEAFEGMGERPFELIRDLATRSAPDSGSAGYFFYEAVNGFNFRSIDKLLSQPITATGGYVYSDVATWCNASNFRILEYTPPKSGDLLTQLRGGAYKFKFETFDLSTFNYKVEYYNLAEKLEPIIGSDEMENKFQSSEEYSRTIFSVLDSGNHESGITTSVNNDPTNWILAKIRYNTLLFNSCDIVVPCNLNLKAGDVIDCSFPKLTQDPAQGISDEKISGKYLILHLSHKFTGDGQTGSTTHITMVRDTNGMYSSSGE